MRQKIIFTMSLDYIANLTDSMNFREGIPRSELRKLLNRKTTVIVRTGEHFLMAGDIPRHIGFVLSGLLRFYYTDANGTEITKHFCIEHTLATSYWSFLHQEESAFSIQALEDSRILAIDYDTYHYLLNGHVCWRSVARKLAEMLFVLKGKKEAELLLYDATERYLRFVQENPDLEKRLNQYHIASYLNIAPESLSRIRAGLKKK
jgi:CRP-like cAMP-binding protein